MLPFALACGVLLGAARAQAPANWHRGIVFGLDEWTTPNATGDSSYARASMDALAATGASNVRLVFTQYQDNVNTTSIYAIDPPSALASATPAAVKSIALYARSLGLNVTVAPILDPNWDNPANGRSSDIDKTNFASRLGIGKNFTEDAWTSWFSSYTAYVLPYASLAQEVGATMFEVASELDIAFSHPPNAPRWRTLIAAIRQAFPPPGLLTIASNTGTLRNITWFDALDAIGVDAYYGLGEQLPLGTSPQIADLVAAWQPIVADLSALASSTGKAIFITEIGYESRPSCHVRPWGTSTRDNDDDSAWLEDHDMQCQAACYEAALEVFTAQPWFRGIYWWLWRSDPSHGGTCDGDFTPHGKPAEVVLRRWYGNYTCEEDGGYGPAFLHPTLDPALEQHQSKSWVDIAGAADMECDGSMAIHRSLQQLHADMGVSNDTVLRSTQKRTWNGYVFGGPDEWSYPGYRYDSYGAQLSLETLATIGADSVEIIAQWYFNNVTDTTMYPITDVNNPLRTSTDDELTAIIQRAHNAGMQVILTPMLDPDWLLPAQQFCRDTTNPGCYWRGQIGLFWPDNECGPGSAYAEWHGNYASFVLHYARLAQTLGVEAFLISHELEHANWNCPDLWLSLIAQVRQVYGGKISAALQPSVLNPQYAQLMRAWIIEMDFTGIDCYLSLPGIQPTKLPWQDVSVESLLQAAQQIMPQFAALYNDTGKKIVCTEVGWAARPWTWAHWGGQAVLDPEDCSVLDQCAAPNAFALAYNWHLQTYYQQDWFDGVLYWLWRADPTAGGMSDDGFVPVGKPAIPLLKAAWAA
jgi:hypothetical protein